MSLYGAFKNRRVTIKPIIIINITMEETLSIRESAKALKKYGSTSKNLLKKQEHYIKHTISKTDTLQGIALKYGVTVSSL